MCLLINQPEGVTFSDDWIRDFHTRNSDGFGYMYAENDVIYTNKTFGGIETILQMYKQVAGRAAALHFRMATHGDVCEINTHPYKILGEDTGYPLFLMHNGVLSIGNTADKTKSDTWHYIRHILKPLLTRDPEMFMDPAFKELVEDHIGASNKFIIMDAYGNTEIFNESSGTEWEANAGKPKAWMSNQYAWSASKAGLYRGNRSYGGYRGSYKSGYEWGDEGDYYGGGWYGSHQKTTPPAGTQTTTPATTTGETQTVEKSEFSEKFFALCRAKAAWGLYHAFSSKDMDEYYDAAGEIYAEAALEAFRAGELTFGDLMQDIRQTLALIRQAKEEEKTRKKEEEKAAAEKLAAEAAARIANSAKAAADALAQAADLFVEAPDPKGNVLPFPVPVVVKHPLPDIPDNVPFTQ